MQQPPPPIASFVNISKRDEITFSSPRPPKRGLILWFCPSCRRWFVARTNWSILRLNLRPPWRGENSRRSRELGRWRKIRRIARGTIRNRRRRLEEGPPGKSASNVGESQEPIVVVVVLLNCPVSASAPCPISVVVRSPSPSFWRGILPEDSRGWRWMWILRRRYHQRQNRTPRCKVSPPRASPAISCLYRYE